MRVEFFAYMRELTGCAETDVPLCSTIRDLISILSKRYGQTFGDKLLTPHGELGPEIIIMISGRHIVHLGGIDAPLKDNDIIQILPMAEDG